MAEDDASERLARLRHLAVDVALVWGPERRIPFRERLRDEHPSVTSAEASELEAWSNRAVDEATSLAEIIHRECPPNEIAGQAEVWRQSVRQLTRHYPGIDESQAGRLLNQGMYFAIKCGRRPTRGMTARVSAGLISGCQVRSQ